MRHWTEFGPGGHFPAIEQPDLLVDDLRAFLRSFRKAEWPDNGLPMWAGPGAPLDSPECATERSSRYARPMARFFDGFSLERVDVGGAVLRVRCGGSGPPVLLLHGHPQTHAMWHRVAPPLAEQFTVVAPDLRGYGESSAPAARPDHAQASKRAMALDGVRLMEHFGFPSFAVAGHDRGGRVAYRMALDHPDVVTRLAVLDTVPTKQHERRSSRVRPPCAHLAPARDADR